ncbi:MAG TPA: hypothetical protein VGB06_04840 [Solirubrobacterales bacterium]
MFGASPEATAERAWSVESEPTLAAGTGMVVPYAVVVPSWNWYTVALPFGLTLPFKVALVGVTAVAAAVVAEGA